MSEATDLFGPHRKARTIGSHQSAMSDSEIWLTPPYIIACLGPFDLDPCAAPEPRPWATAKRHYTREHNGLAKPWSGLCL